MTTGEAARALEHFRSVSGPCSFRGVNRTGDGERGSGGDRLARLPAAKRAELAFVVELVCDGFAQALERRTQERFRRGEVLKVILFGSYARGDWVEDPVGRYFSDFDLLVVVNHEDLTDPSEFWGPTEQRLLEALTQGERLRTPVSLIVHSLEDVNAQLRLGRYFFIDIARDGIPLYEAQGHPFAAAEPLTPDAALSETKLLLEQWSQSGVEFLETAKFASAQGWLKRAAFLLHQATESLYHGFLVVSSLYSPKTHNLNRLRALCEAQDKRLAAVWPKGTRFERQAYERLKAAYVNARYSAEYAITAEQLDWLMAQVGRLQAIIETLSRERLEALRAAA